MQLSSYLRSTVTEAPCQTRTVLPEQLLGLQASKVVTQSRLVANGQLYVNTAGFSPPQHRGRAAMSIASRPDLKIDIDMLLSPRPNENVAQVSVACSLSACLPPAP